MEELRFACDATLGRLARWLRLAGLDTSFDPGAPPLATAARARVDGRWLLTRDRALAAGAGPRVLLLQADATGRQIAELRERLPVVADAARFLTRCSCCNTPLREAARETVLERVPPYVAAHAARFVACPTCGRVYWPGTHVGRIVRTLETWFGARPAAPPRALTPP